LYCSFFVDCKYSVLILLSNLVLIYLDDIRTNIMVFLSIAIYLYYSVLFLIMLSRKLYLYLLVLHFKFKKKFILFLKVTLVYLRRFIFKISIFFIGLLIYFLKNNLFLKLKYYFYSCHKFNKKLNQGLDHSLLPFTC